MADQDHVEAVSARERLVLALDVEDLVTARSLAADLAPFVATVKVGLELFCAEGPPAIECFVEAGFDVFADLKLHDIPTTVRRAAQAIALYGPKYVSVHTAGGEDMLRAAVEGLHAGANGSIEPIALGITILTSDTSAPPELLAARAALGARAGLGGLVCGGPDLPVVRAAAPGLLRLVPGTRPPGSSSDDQARVMTPKEAVSLGADLLVVGRAVTRAADPIAAAAELVDSLA